MHPDYLRKLFSETAVATMSGVIPNIHGEVMSIFTTLLKLFFPWLGKMDFCQ